MFTATDRIFAYIRLESAARRRAGRQGRRAGKGRPAGRPHRLADVYDLGQEFFRWEIATAVAGSIIGINAFNQPDVEASKIETKKLTSEYEAKGSLPAEKPILKKQASNSSPTRRTRPTSPKRLAPIARWQTTCARISLV